MNFPEKLKPYKGIIFFVVALLAANYFWKFTITGDENGDQVLFFGMDISQPFIFLASHIAKVTHALINFFGMEITLFSNNVLRYENHNSVWVVWSCTGLKQTFIFTIIMIFARGIWKNKMWYIPLGWIAIYIINVLRISIITAVIKTHPELFSLLHEHIFKYLFYILIFMIWVYWEEKVVGK